MSNAAALALTLGLLVAGSVFVWNTDRVFLQVAKAHGSLPLLLRAWTTPIRSITARLQQEGNTMNSTNRDCHAGHIMFDRRCDMPAGHTGYHTDGDISWVGRERWRFAGREWTADGIPFYVWQLRNLDGTVNSVSMAPVSDVLKGA